ncbi:MAG: ABC transporter permease/substrate-binding protein [Candidatus Hydrogenedentales bacterium]
MNERLRQQIELLPEYLAGHVVITLAAMAAGIAVSIPLGIAITRVRPLRGPVMNTVSVVQTVPGLAILALMVPLFSQIGFVPAFVALTLYSMLPMVRNTITGLDGVASNVLEAARGIGMTPTQILFRVRLPLAVPVIVAGIRTATVWTVGMATLATVVGWTTLGNYIFSGLQTQNYTAVIFGSVVAAALALLLDNAIGWFERYTAKQRAAAPAAGGARRLKWAGGATAAAAAIAAATWLGWDKTQETDYVVGGKGFTEQYIMTGLMATLLEDAGYKVAVKDTLGSTVAFDATARGDVDAYVEYSGTAWANFMKRSDNPGGEAVLSQVIQWLEERHGIITLGPAGFENLYALAMREEDAAAKNIRTIEDLLPYAPRMKIGSDYEFFSRPEWYTLRETYDIEFAARLSFDPSLMYAALREGEVDVITAYSTDGRVPAYNLRILEDPRNAFLPYDGLIVMSAEAAQDPVFRAALAPMVGAIDDEDMRIANKIVDVDKQPVQSAVDYLLGVIAESKKRNGSSRQPED